MLGPLQITHGGPILMVQVENEYGFYGKDAGYMGALRQALIDAGFDVPLFACNPTERPRATATAPICSTSSISAATRPAAFKALRDVQPKGPLMCGEFYPGWFDTWGVAAPQGRRRHADLADLEYMLKHDASFSIYMAHGGTTFGLWSGADRPVQARHQQLRLRRADQRGRLATATNSADPRGDGQLPAAGETLPEPPPPTPVVGDPVLHSDPSAPVFDNLPEPTADV